MTQGTPRMRAIARELRLMRKALPEVLALQATIGQMTATIARLIGENDRLQRGEH